MALAAIGAALASPVGNFVTNQLSQILQPQNLQRQSVFNEGLLQQLSPQPRVAQQRVFNTNPQGPQGQVNPFQNLAPAPPRGQELATGNLVETILSGLVNPRANNQLTGSEINVGRLPGPRG